MILVKNLVNSGILCVVLGNANGQKQQWLVFTEQLLCSRHCMKCLHVLLHQLLCSRHSMKCLHVLLHLRLTSTHLGNYYFTTLQIRKQRCREMGGDVPLQLGSSSFLFQLLSCVQLFCDPTDCSLPGSSDHGISKVRIVEWVAIPFSRASS